MSQFKVVKIDETPMWAEVMRKRAGKLTGVYIYDDGEQTNCVEVTPSFWLEFIQTEPENYPEDDEERERLFDDIMEAEARAGDSSHYRHCSAVEKLSPTVLGDFEDMDEAREYAHANCGSL